MTDISQPTPTPPSGPPSLPPHLERHGQQMEGVQQADAAALEQRNAAMLKPMSALASINATPMPQPPEPQKPPPAPDAKEYQKDAMAFASAMAVLGAVAGRFTRAPGGAALSAFAGALKGWQSGNLQAYENAAKEWEQNTKAAVENNRQVMEKYRLALADRKMNIDEQMSQIQLISAQYHDQIMYDAAAAKNYTLVAQIYEKNFEYTQKAAEAAAKLQEKREEQAVKAKQSAAYWMNHPEEFAKLPPAQQATVKQLMELHKTGIDTSPAAPGPGAGLQPPTQVAALTPEGGATDAPTTGVQPTQGTPPESGISRAMNNLGWDKDTLDAAARTFNKTGKMPTNLGTRQYAGMISGAIQKRATELMRDEGKTPEERAKDWQLYRAAQPAINNFMSGANGRTTRSLGVVVDHLETMRELGDALKNGNIQKANQLMQWIATQTGKPAPTNIAAAAQIVGPEIVKALGVAGAGSSHERDAAGAIFSQIKSPEQINGAIDTVQPLMAGQLEGMERQWTVGTGLPVDLFYALVGPKGTKWLQRNGPSRGATPTSNDGWTVREK